MSGGKPHDIEAFVDKMVSEGVYTTKERLKTYVARVFQGTNLAGKRVLDIGGGNGLLSFYAAASGAASVTCLDPEASGSTSGMLETFKRLSAGLAVNNVILRPIDFQSYEHEGDKFDVIILYNSINHLNERACMSLLESDESTKAYRDIFWKLRSIAAPEAQIILCDCARSNFFDMVGIRNPFAPSVQWEKHQNPVVWQRMLADAGFDNPMITWTSLNVLKKPGRVLFANRVAAYFFDSHFRLSMRLGV